VTFAPTTTFAEPRLPTPPRLAHRPLDHVHFRPLCRAMVSVCGTCQGLQKHLKGSQNIQETDGETLQWMNTSLPSLRASGNNCRACALLLNGILLHHERFAGIDEQCIQVRAESFVSKPGRTFQDHLSVEMRWKVQDDQDDCLDEDQHEHVGYPDLKLEFYTDGGYFTLFRADMHNIPHLACFLTSRF